MFNNQDRETAIGVLKVADNSHFLYSLLLLQKRGKKEKKSSPLIISTLCQSFSYSLMKNIPKCQEPCSLINMDDI